MSCHFRHSNPGSSSHSIDYALPAPGSNHSASRHRTILQLNLLNPTGHVIHQQVKYSTSVRSAHTELMCFIFISEQTATFAPYSIN